MSAASQVFTPRVVRASTSRMPRPRPIWPLVRRGLADRRRIVLAWGMSGGLLCAFTAGVYPSVQDSLRQLLEGYPAGLKEAFSIGELSTVEDYLSAEAFGLILPVAVAFFAIRLVVRSIAVPEEAGHLDSLLAAPISRSQLALATMVTTGLALVGVLCLIGGLTWASATAFGADLSLGLLAAGVANVWPFAVFFAAFALVVTGLRAGAGVVTGISGATLISMYVIDLVGRLADSLDFLRYLSLFKYYGAAIRDGIDPLAFVGVSLVGFLLAGMGARLFERRDLLG